jgi:hypothetical protein
MRWPIERCRSCDAPIIWATSVNGKAMPINAEPVENGNVALQPRQGMGPLAVVLSVAKRFGRTDLHTSHHSNCPQANGWRKATRR